MGYLIQSRYLTTMCNHLQNSDNRVPAMLLNAEMDFLTTVPLLHPTTLLETINIPICDILMSKMTNGTDEVRNGACKGFANLCSTPTYLPIVLQHPLMQVFCGMVARPHGNLLITALVSLTAIFGSRSPHKE